MNMKYDFQIPMMVIFVIVWWRIILFF